MQIHYRAYPLLALAALALASCGNGADTTTASTQSAPSATTTAATTPSTTPVASDGGDESETGDVDPNWQIVPKGQWGHYSSVGKGFDKGEGAVDVRLVESECDEEGKSGDIAPKGKKMCAFVVELKNVGKKPYQADEPGGVMTEDGALHDPRPEDQELSWKYNEDEHGTYVMDLNPGDTFTYTHLVAIPKDAQPMSLLYPAQTMVENPTMELQVK